MLAMDVSNAFFISQGNMRGPLFDHPNSSSARENSSQTVSFSKYRICAATTDKNGESIVGVTLQINKILMFCMVYFNLQRYRNRENLTSKLQPGGRVNGMSLWII
ncbi:hypothetical protein V6N12_038934 [Hibiscus sabdariffa]|uniref:Uncharacterized protein n=1 Tax=Hibiscus sabdariffa TaxID=183260 RepID=A0ABR2DZ63_9ROSI